MKCDQWVELTGLPHQPRRGDPPLLHLQVVPLCHRAGQCSCLDVEVGGEGRDYMCQHRPVVHGIRHVIRAMSAHLCPQVVKHVQGFL